MTCPTSGHLIHGVMLVDTLTPSPDWAANAEERRVKCQAADYVHFVADFGRGLVVHRLTILNGSERATAWLAGQSGAAKVGRVNTGKGEERTERPLPDWLESG